MDIKKALFAYGDKVVFLLFLALFLFAAFKLVSPSNQDNNDVVLNGGGGTSAGDPDILIAPEAEAVKRKVDLPLDGERARLAEGGVAEDYDDVFPLEGKEKSCPECAWLVPIELEKCPKCGYPFEHRHGDKDKDGMPDTWEDKYAEKWKDKFPNENYPAKVTDSEVPDADKDPDLDGYANIDEYQGGSDPGDPKSIPQMFVVHEIGSQLVDILFKGFIVHAGGEYDVPDPKYWALEINWGRDTKTKIIPYGGYFHGYRLFPLVKTIEMRPNPRLGEGVKVPFEIWSLTIQKKNRKKIVVNRNEEVRESELYTRLRVTRGPDKNKIIGPLYDTDKFTANSKTFTVQSVMEDEVLLTDEKNQKIVLRKGR
jgi:hypothetical protein